MARSFLMILTLLTFGGGGCVSVCRQPTEPEAISRAPNSWGAHLKSGFKVRGEALTADDIMWFLDRGIFWKFRISFPVQKGTELTLAKHTLTEQGTFEKNVVARGGSFRGASGTEVIVVIYPESDDTSIVYFGRPDSATRRKVAPLWTSDDHTVVFKKPGTRVATIDNGIVLVTFPKDDRRARSVAKEDLYAYITLEMEATD